MNTLFPVDPVYPDGFFYHPEFITKEEEIKLLKDISNIELHNFAFQGYIANRKTASYGFDYNFENRSLASGKDIPNQFNYLIERVGKLLAIAGPEFKELLITEYPEGSVINWHRDAPPFDIIAGISLLSDCKFRLRPQEKEKQTRTSIISFPVQRRSLYVMQGASRSEWQHSISPVKHVRYSITLRTLKK